MTFASHYRITEPIAEVLSRISHREFLTRLAWIELQWERPSRTDYYLMQIAWAIFQVKSVKEILLSTFKLPFQAWKKPRKVKPVDPKFQGPPPMTQADIARVQAAMTRFKAKMAKQAKSKPRPEGRSLLQKRRTRGKQ